MKLKQTLYKLSALYGCLYTADQSLVVFLERSFVHPSQDLHRRQNMQRIYKWEVLTCYSSCFVTKLLNDFADWKYRKKLKQSNSILLFLKRKSIMIFTKGINV